MTAEPIESASMQGWHTKDRTIMGPVLFAFLWPIWKLAELRGFIIDRENERSGL